MMVIETNLVLIDVMIYHDVHFMMNHDVSCISEDHDRSFPLKAHPSWDPFLPIVNRGIIATVE